MLVARLDRARAIARVFVDRGAKVDAVNSASGHFMNLAFYLEHPDDEALIQETGDRAAARENTRAPVERAERALTELIQAIQECCDVAEVDVDSGKINVSRRFVEEVCGREYDFDNQEFGAWFWEIVLQLSIPIGRALEAGVKPSGRGRPRLHYYERFAIRLISIAQAIGINARRDDGSPSEELVTLALDCDQFLPHHHQARQKLTAANRLKAALEHRSKIKSADDSDLIALQVDGKS